MAECPHGFAKPTQCLECMEDGPVVAPPKWAKVDAPFPAMYANDCTCFDRIIVGQRIQRWDLGGERTVYRHVGCSP